MLIQEETLVIVLFKTINDKAPITPYISWKWNNEIKEIFAPRGNEHKAGNEFR